MEQNVNLNEEVMEATEEIVTVESGSNVAAKVIMGVGLTALAGGLLYKYVIKHVIAKIKAKKEEKNGKKDLGRIFEEVHKDDKELEAEFQNIEE